MRRYGEVLRVPHVAALVAATLLARFPIGINALAVILYLRERTGSFAVAGVVAGSLALGSGVGAPVQGRLVDRFGQRTVLPPLAFVHAAALGLLVLSTELGAPTAALVCSGLALSVVLALVVATREPYLLVYLDAPIAGMTLADAAAEESTLRGLGWLLAPVLPVLVAARLWQARVIRPPVAGRVSWF